MNEARKLGNILIILGVLLLVSATILVMYNIDQDGDVGRATASIVSDLSDAIASRGENMPKNEDEAVAMRLNGQDVIEIDGHTYIGYLTVPSQSLELPILSEWSYPNLKIAPCCYYGSVFESNLVLAGHNYRSHFGKLNNLKVDDVIRFTNVFGGVTTYRVVELQSLRPIAVDAMKKSEFDLTLFTCNLSGNARFTVRCMRIA